MRIARTDELSARPREQAILRRSIATCCIVLALGSVTSGVAQAENWVRVGPADSALWYDSDSVRQIADSLVGFWVSKGPSRTTKGTDGLTQYPIYNLVDCQARTVGSKASVDTGQKLEPAAANSDLGALIAKVCA